MDYGLCSPINSKILFKFRGSICSDARGAKQLAFTIFLMIGKVFNAFGYVFILPRVFQDISQIHRELRLLKEDPNLPQNVRQSISVPKTFHRIQQYALVHGVLNFSMARYLNHKLTDAEIKAVIYTCGFGPFFDDFIDDFEIDPQKLTEMIAENHAVIPSNLEEEAYSFLLGRVYQCVPNKNWFYVEFERLLHAQIQSKLLKNQSISRTLATGISQNKGGVSAHLFRSMINEVMDEKEKHMLFQLGVVGQFMDDIFDLYEDHREGLKTLANDFEGDFTVVYQRFLDEIDKLKSGIWAMDISNQRKRRFHRELMLIISGGLLAGQQFLKLQRNLKHFNLSNIPRKSLIIDMENRWNHLKMLKLAIQFS